MSLATSAFVSVVLPYAKRKFHRYREGGFDAEMTKAEWEYILLEYDETLDSVTNYCTTAIQYGYMALFSAAAPATTLVALASNLLILRLYGYKYLINYRRIEPRGCQDVGIFTHIYEFINVAAVLTTSKLLGAAAAERDKTRPCATRQSSCRSPRYLRRRWSRVCASRRGALLAAARRACGRSSGRAGSWRCGSAAAPSSFPARTAGART